MRLFAPASLIALLSVFAPIPCRAAIYLSGSLYFQSAKAPLPAIGVSLYAPDSFDLMPGDSQEVLGTTRTLPNGSFVVRAPVPGLYRVIVNQDGYLPINQLVRIPAVGKVGLDLALRTAPPLRLNLVDADGKPLTEPVNPAPGGKAQARKSNKGFAQGWIWMEWAGHHARVTAAGQYGYLRFPRTGPLEIPAPTGLPLQDLLHAWVELRAPGMGVAQIELDRWPDAPVEARFQEGSVLEGLISDAAGKPVKDAKVGAVRVLPDGTSIDHFPYAIPSEGSTFPQWFGMSAITDAVGHFSIPHLLRDHYEVAVIYPTGEARSSPIRISGDRAAVSLSLGNKAFADSSLSLPRGGSEYLDQLPLLGILERLDPQAIGKTVSISGRVLNKLTGVPVKNAEVSLRTPSQGQPVDSTRALADGSYTVRAFPLQRCILRVDEESSVVSEQKLTVPATNVRHVEVSLEPLPSTTLIVTGADGKPIASDGIQVYVVLDWGEATVEGSWRGDVTAGGKVSVTAPRWDVPAGEAPVDSPSNILIAVRDTALGYGQAHLDRWPTGPVGVQLGPWSSLAGVVLGPDGKPAPGSLLFLGRAALVPGAGALPSIPIWVRATADEKGVFEITGIPPGLYSLDAAYKDQRFHAETIPVAGKRVDVTVQAPK